MKEMRAVLILRHANVISVHKLIQAYGTHLFAVLDNMDSCGASRVARHVTRNTRAAGKCAMLMSQSGHIVFLK